MYADIKDIWHDDTDDLKLPHSQVSFAGKNLFKLREPSWLQPQCGLNHEWLMQPMLDMRPLRLLWFRMAKTNKEIIQVGAMWQCSRGEFKKFLQIVDEIWNFWRVSFWMKPASSYILGHYKSLGYHVQWCLLRDSILQTVSLQLYSHSPARTHLLQS